MAQRPPSAVPPLASPRPPVGQGSTGQPQIESTTRRQKRPRWRSISFENPFHWHDLYILRTQTDVKFLDDPIFGQNIRRLGGVVLNRRRTRTDQLLLERLGIGRHSYDLKTVRAQMF